MTGKVAYAVTSGEYSDYRVHALFATRELAEAAIRDGTINSYGEPQEVEEFPWYDDATPLGKEVQR